MKIKLKALKLPSISAELIRPVSSSSSSAYENTGVTINKIYIQDISGVLKGVQLVVAFNAWVAYSELPVSQTITKKMKIRINSVDYEVIDIMEKENSYFEDHYQLNLQRKNT